MFKMLVVDDEYLIRYSLAMTFKDCDISVTTAESGEEALRAIREDRFDICFLDLHLPDMSGVEVLKALISDGCCTKVIVMSGDIMNKETQQLVRENAILFMEKPFNLDYVKSIANLIITRLANTSIAGGNGPIVKHLTNNERRRQVRYASGNVIICSTATPEFDASGVNFEASLKDISSGGMGLVTAHPVEPGWMLTLFDGENINQGTVRWTAAAQQMGTYDFGVHLSAPL